jgi:leucyl/phenylalanyl-tRNA--protein transferase
MGRVHSVEAWLDERLVGGLYGVHIGAAFFGESMFCAPEDGGTDASKVCLVQLARQLLDGRFRLFDTQFRTPHLARFGCIEIARRRYLDLLERAVAAQAAWPTFAIEPRDRLAGEATRPRAL